MSEQPRPRREDLRKKPEPWRPAAYELPEHHAIKALHRGDATPEQQKKALEWIVQRAAMTHDQSFFPGDPLVTAFIEGRRSVGLQILKLVTTKAETKRGDM